MFSRVLRAQLLKLKGTFALKLAVLAPAVVIGLILFITSQSPFSTLRRGGPGNEWNALARLVYFFWGLLMLPLYVTVESALIAGLDHSENQWKALFTRPVPRWTHYLSTLIAVVAMLTLSTIVLVGGILAIGKILPYLQTEVQFKVPLPASIFVQAAQMTGLVFLALSMQHWVSLRFRTFGVATGVGIVGLVVAYAMVLSSQPNGSWTQYFPWALPMLVQARWKVDLASVICISLVGGCLVAVAGCIEFSRRDVE